VRDGAWRAINDAAIIGLVDELHELRKVDPERTAQFIAKARDELAEVRDVAVRAAAIDAKLARRVMPTHDDEAAEKSAPKKRT
jgi:hypothetical protein